MRLCAEGVVKSFGPRRIFGPIDLELTPGTTLAVTGANGSGKTTLLKVLAGLARPTRGRVSLADDTGTVPVHDRPQAIGWCAPDLQLYDELTPVENLAFFARLLGQPADDASIAARLAATGLDPSRRVPSRALSTGQRQRMKLAFATLHAPPVLLLDEPGANLDEAGRQLVARVLRERQEAGRFVNVVASNDPRDLEGATRSLAL